MKKEKPKPYRDFNSFLRERFGCRVQKITIDAGFTCPNRDGCISTDGCIYCNPRGSGTGAHARGLSITAQIQMAKQALKKRYKAKKFIAYFQAFTNTYAPIDILKKRYDEALTDPEVVGISIGTRPDCAGDAVLDLIEDYKKTHMVWMEYGLQSAHDKTLALINRGHDSGAFADAVKRTKERGILTCAHVIIGLPGESKDLMLRTADFLGESGVDGVKIHLLYVVRGTRLADWYMKKKFRCLTMEQYADIVSDFIARLPEGIVIQRITGDPHSKELLAPAWALNKNRTIEMILTRMAQKGIVQGSLAGKRNSHTP